MGYSMIFRKAQYPVSEHGCSDLLSEVTDHNVYVLVPEEASVGLPTYRTQDQLVRAGAEQEFECVKPNNWAYQIFSEQKVPKNI